MVYSIINLQTQAYNFLLTFDTPKKNNNTHSQKKKKFELGSGFLKHDVVRATTIYFYALAGPTLIWPKIPSKTKKANLAHLLKLK